MARKRTSTPTADTDRELGDHIHSLGLGTVEEYREWCARNGFSRKLNKHWKRRCRERFHHRQRDALDRLDQRKREQRNLIDVIRGICEGQIEEHDVTQQHLKRLCAVLKPGRGPQLERQVNRPALLRIVSHLNSCRAKVFHGSPVIAELGEHPGNTFIEALALAAAHSAAWQRPVEDWKPRSHNPHRQFHSLLRHLFVCYDDMPLFFDSVWFMGRTREAAERRGWYRHVGRGQNIRNCKLPLAYTKKMAHHFLRAPSDVTMDQALRWGQVHGLGGDDRLARAIFGTRLADNFEHDAFWTSVMRWFAAHPLLDRAHIGPMIDYIHNQRFVAEQVYVGPGRREVSPPPQPNFTMKGRTPAGLLRKVNHWHRRLATDNTHQLRQWQPSGIDAFEYLEGSIQNRSLKCWTIRELLSSKALVAEGRQLKHCVATYASSCAQGHCSIWTMEIESSDGRKKLITVEVQNRGRMISQARGKLNRLAHEKERSVLRRWAIAQGLKLSKYV